jgi:hypothetical protein
MKRGFTVFPDRLNCLLILGVLSVIVFFPLQASAINQFNFTISDIVYQSTITSSGANIGYTVTATSNGNSVTPTCNPVSGSLFILGNTPVYCSAANNGGTVGAASFIITVSGTDSTPPNIIPPPNVIVYQNQNQTNPLTTVDIGVPLVNDNLDTSPLVINDHPSTGFPLNSTLVTWTTTDHSGNSNTATQTVTVKVFTGVIVNASPPSGLYKIAQSVVLSSNSTVPIYYTFDGTTPTTSSAIYSNPIPVNSNMVLKFFATADEFGNALGVVTATYTIDASPPIITLNGLSPTIISQGSTYVDAGATANDYFAGNLTSSIITANPVNTLILGNYTVTYNVSDAAGNAATLVTRTVKVSSASIITHMSDTTASSGWAIYSTRSILAENVNATSQLVGDNIDTITIKLKKSGATTTGTAEIGIFNTDLSVKKLFATKDVSTLTTGYLDYTFSLPSGQTYQIQSGDRIGIKFTGGTATTDNISIMRDTDPADPFDGTNSYLTYYTTTWLSATANDLYMILKENSAPSIGDTTPPVITLLGSNPVTVQMNSSYLDAGATANDNQDGNITPSIITVNPVNTSVLGSYTVTYNVSDVADNAATQVTRTVNVVDNTIPIVSSTPLAGLYNSTQNITLVSSNPSIIHYTTNGATPTTSSPVYDIPIPVNTDTTLKFFGKTLTGNSGPITTALYTIDTISPIITLNGNAHVSVDIGSPYADVGATATDNVDGNVTSSILMVNPVNTSILGSYTITYNISDAAGNAATQVTRTVEVVDQIPPVITLLGSNPVIVNLNSPYVDAGATALDNVDGDITSAIVIVNSVNTSVLASYTVTYNVSDIAGNITPEVVRTVYVVDPLDLTAPVISSVTPASSSTVNGLFSANYTLDESVHLGSITFTRTSGLPDTLTHFYNFTTGDKTPGPHSISRATLETGFTNSLVSGTVYTMVVSAADAVSNTATVSNTLISYDVTAPTTTASPLGGTYTSAQSVTLTANEVATIYYTTNGATPTVSSTVYSSPIPISATTTLMFFAKDTAGNPETVQTLVYTITSFSPITHMSDTTKSTGYKTYSGRPINAEYVTSTSQLVGDNIDTITLNLKKSGAPTGIAEIGVFNTDLSVKKLFATKDVSTLTTSYVDYTFSLPSGQTYQIQSGDRIGIKYTGGTSTVNLSVRVDTAVADPFDGVNSYYTYYTTSWISTNTTWDISMILRQTSSGTSDVTAPTTTASPLGGTYTSAQSVTLTANEVATIYYTTNGATPTVSSTVYSSPIPISATTTLMFFAKDTAGNPETVQTLVYTITSFSPITHMSDTTASSGWAIYSTRSILAENVNATSQLVGDNIDTITIKLKKSGATTTGTAEIGIFNTDLSVKKLFATKDVSTLTTGYLDYTFSLPSGQTYQIQSGDRIGIKFTGGTATTDNISIMRDTTIADPFDGTNSYLTYYTTTWLSATANDLYMILRQSSP